MLTRIGTFAVRRRRLVLVAAVVIFAVSGAVGGGVAKELSSGGFDDPAAESTKAEDYLLDHFQAAGTPNIVLLVTADPGTTVDTPEVAYAGAALTTELAAEPHMAYVASYWSTGGAPPLKTATGSRALVFARYDGDSNELNKVMDTHHAPLRATAPGSPCRSAGSARSSARSAHTIEHDLVRAEMIALPITLILLLLVFGSGRGRAAARDRRAVGGRHVPRAPRAQQVHRGLGVLAEPHHRDGSRPRHRLQPLHRVALPRESCAADTSRTTRWSAPCAPLGAPSRSARSPSRRRCARCSCSRLAFLRSFAYAGVAVAALAGIYAVVVLPAMLAVLGHRVDALTLWKRSTNPPEEGFWHGMAMRVMRRPIPFVAGALVVLFFLGSPALRMQLGLPDDRVLPPSKPGRVVSDIIRTEFTSEEAGALAVVAPGVDPDAHAAEIDAFAIAAVGPPRCGAGGRRHRQLPARRCRRAGGVEPRASTPASRALTRRT